MKRKTQIISILLCLVSTAYTIWYMHFAPPYKNVGALSKIGLEHPVYFAIWGVLTYFSLTLALTLAYKKYTKTKAYIPLLVVSGIGMALTLTNDFDFDKKVQYYLHCTGSLMFSAVTGITVFLLFLICFKKGAIFKIFTVASGVILTVDLICLLIFKETGLIEALPIFAGYIMLSAVNLRREKIETTR